MKKIYIIHRWAGNSTDDWRPWLKKELEAFGFEVIVPDMPDTEVPVIESWVNHLSKVVTDPNENTFFIGHSIGCQTILRYLESINTKIGGLIFVAPWFKLDNLEDEEVEQIAKPWLETSIDFAKVKNNTYSIQSFLSSDEPFGCVSENKKVLEQDLESKVTILESRGHFTEDDNELELPEIIPTVLQSILNIEYPIVYEWNDEPNTKYDEHEHKGKVSFYVIEGSVAFTSGINQIVSQYQRIDVPVGVKHAATVGSEGCRYIVGQEIEGDA
ncbi:MAG: alpha/beta hydrolase [Candidatus Pacebacteria bacterium]|nr:alpha/beta hydrolase [Candidatus Paceibacterota bacterium]